MESSLLCRSPISTTVSFGPLLFCWFSLDSVFMLCSLSMSTKIHPFMTWPRLDTMGSMARSKQAKISKAHLQILNLFSQISERIERYWSSVIFPSPLHKLYSPGRFAFRLLVGMDKVQEKSALFIKWIETCLNYWNELCRELYSTGLAHLGLGFKNRPGRSWMPGSKLRRTQRLPIFVSLTSLSQNHNYLLKKLSKAEEQDTRKHGESMAKALKTVMCPGAFSRLPLSPAFSLEENRLRDSLDALDAAFQALRWQPKLLSRHVETIGDKSWYIVPNLERSRLAHLEYAEVQGWLKWYAEIACQTMFQMSEPQTTADWTGFERHFSQVGLPSNLCDALLTGVPIPPPNSDADERLGGWGQKPWRSRAIFAGITTIATCT